MTLAEERELEIISECQGSRFKVLYYSSHTQSYKYNQ